MNYRKGGIFFDKDDFLYYWSRLIPRIDKEICKAPYLGFRDASVSFTAYVRCIECEVIALAVMRLLLKCAYHTGASYGKFTLGYNMRIPKDDSLTGAENILYREAISFIVGPAISLTDNDGNMSPNIDVFYWVLKAAMKKAETYGVEVLSGLFLRIYLKDDSGPSEIMLGLSSEELARIIQDLMNTGNSGSDEERKALPIKKSKKSIPKYITSLNPPMAKLRPFIVADLETVLVDDEHVPYAAGFQLVSPGEDVAAKPDYSIETYFSEDHLGLIGEF